ncbi:MAG: hypothetical protein IJ727_01280 [Treponema sp.]|nr:hypothetical protein [Treponema sp.]
MFSARSLSFISWEAARKSFRKATLQLFGKIVELLNPLHFVALVESPDGTHIIRVILDVVPPSPIGEVEPVCALHIVLSVLARRPIQRICSKAIATTKAASRVYVKAVCCICTAGVVEQWSARARNRG